MNLTACHLGSHPPQGTSNVVCHRRRRGVRVWCVMQMTSRFTARERWGTTPDRIKCRKRRRETRRFALNGNCEVAEDGVVFVSSSRRGQSLSRRREARRREERWGMVYHLHHTQVPSKVCSEWGKKKTKTSVGGLIFGCSRCLTQQQLDGSWRRVVFCFFFISRGSDRS